jgi:hypothetical protein
MRVDGASGTAMFDCHCKKKKKKQKKKKKNKKNVDIKFNAHDTFLKLPSSGTLKITFLRYAQNYLPQVTLKITFLRYAQNYLPQVRSKLPSSGDAQNYLPQVRSKSKNWKTKYVFLNLLEQQKQMV